MLTLRVRGAPPALRNLELFPSRVGADDQRYLCLAVRGGGVGRRLFCPGARPAKGRWRWASPGYGSDGAATRRRRIRAGVRKGGDGRLELRLGLREFRPGQLGWAVLSGWIGATCRPRPERAEGRPRPRRAAAARTAASTAPRRGLPGPHLRAAAHGLHGREPARTPQRRGAGQEDRAHLRRRPQRLHRAVVRILDRGGAGARSSSSGSRPGRGAVMRKALRHGHELANHSLRHEPLPPTRAYARPALASRRRRTSALCVSAPGRRLGLERRKRRGAQRDVDGAVGRRHQVGGCPARGRSTTGSWEGPTPGRSSSCTMAAATAPRRSPRCRTSSRR